MSRQARGPTAAAGGDQERPQERQERPQETQRTAVPAAAGREEVRRAERDSLTIDILLNSSLG